MRQRSTVRYLVFALSLSMASPSWAQQPAAQTWRTFAESLQPGALVNVDLSDGTSVEGTVLSRSEQGLVINPKTRLPVQPWSISYAEIRSIEPRREGLKPGMKVAIGIGAGVGAALLIGALVAVAVSD